MTPRLVLFTRYPEEGAAKTRLIPALGPSGAARVHRILTERTLGVLRASGLTVEVQFTGAGEAAFRDWLGHEYVAVEQPEGDLTARLLAALDPAPVVFFGADTPDLSVSHVHAAIAALKGKDAVIGPAEDGGYYLIGLARPFPFLFTDMPWSTPEVLPETVRRLEQHGLSYAMLEPLADCDRPEDLARWPWLAQAQ